MIATTERRQAETQVVSCVVKLCAMLAVVTTTGCAAWTNPVANGIPARLLPEELLAESRESLEQIPLTYLRRKPPEEFTLGPGDLLGVYVEGVLGLEDQLPPVNFPESANLPPSVGFPIPVREDGTVPLPLVPAIQVEGLTATEAQDKIIQAYTQDKEILIAEEARVLVTVIRPRHVRILVIRQDSPESRQGQTIGRTAFGISQTLGGTRRGTGAILELPADEADVLAALAQTGGLPGGDAEDEIVIQRGYAGEEVVDKLPEGVRDSFQPKNKKQAAPEARTVRIPLRLPRGTPPPFDPEDIELQDGDIVFIEARDTEFYYTGGILPSFELALPRDYDLDVVEAIARGGGALVSGPISSNNFNVGGGILGNVGIGFPNPSLLTVLRRLPDGSQVPIRVDINDALRDPRENILVQSGDILILQETTGEAFARWMSRQFGFSYFQGLFGGSSAGQVSAQLP